MVTEYQARTLENVVDARIGILQFEKEEDDEMEEDCSFCRSLDCDILFALSFTLIIIGLLILIVIFWLKECDYLFDSTKPKGTFNFPILTTNPSLYNNKHSSNGEVFSTSLTDELNTNSDLIESQIADNIQCIYTFVARKGQRVKLEFTDFQLAGTVDNCEVEYVDIYSELKDPNEDLLSVEVGGRYCGTVAPTIRISLYNIIVLVFHSRVGKKRNENLVIKGKYSFISDEKYIAGLPLPKISMCSFLIEHNGRKSKGVILSPTYPGVYPNNIICVYLLKGKPNERIRIFLKDFDIYFGGEHCPYDVLTIYDGNDNTSPIIKKVCGLQQKMEIFSSSNNLYIEFLTSDPFKNDQRGFLIEYEFSSRFVHIPKLIQSSKGVTHIRGTECDVRVQSSKESTHYIYSPNFPDMYPSNISCTYILDGLQGDQNLEKVLLTFEQLAVFSENYNNVGVINNGINNNDIECPSAYVGIAYDINNIKAVLSNSEGSAFDKILCERLVSGNELMGPYESKSSRMVVDFESADNPRNDGNVNLGYGFKARVDFRTDFGVPGEAVGDSNKCLFRFKDKKGSFNSPRFPSNYPLDTTCTYLIEGNPGDQIIINFDAFKLFEDLSTDICNDYIELYNVFTDKRGQETFQLQEKYCWNMKPGPSISAYNAYKMKLIFVSSHEGSSNGFKATYKIKKRFKEEIPSVEGKDDDHCGVSIVASDGFTSGTFKSPNYGTKYAKNTYCDWEIVAREDHQIHLKIGKLDVEGTLDSDRFSCLSAVIRVLPDVTDPTSVIQVCGDVATNVKPVTSKGNKLRISFYTSMDKVNGLKGFLYEWTEVKIVEKDSECSGDDKYLCTYSKMCIDKELRCNSMYNCGLNDESDETHCNITELASDLRSVIAAGIFSGAILLFILVFFAFLFKKKMEKRRIKNSIRSSNFRGAKPRIPYRQQQPVGRIIVSNKDLDLSRYEHGQNGLISSPLTSRFINHDATGIVPPTSTTTTDSIKNLDESCNVNRNMLLTTRLDDKTFDC
uniref:CUB domain-containing protein n=1 Tax=Strongyloides papillosus TaxID=174720 RepID=A0A0N5B9P2_STREA